MMKLTVRHFHRSASAAHAHVCVDGIPVAYVKVTRDAADGVYAACTVETGAIEKWVQRKRLSDRRQRKARASA